MAVGYPLNTWQVIYGRTCGIAVAFQLSRILREAAHVVRVLGSCVSSSAVPGK